MTSRRVCGVFLACFGIVAVARAAEGPEDRIEAMLQAPGYQNGRWGLLVLDRKTGAVIYRRNADQLFRPASVAKLYAMAAALAELGPDFRFQTPVVRLGVVDPNGGSCAAT